MRYITGFLIICGVVLLYLSPQKFVKLASLRSPADISTHYNLSLQQTVEPQSLISEIPYERGRFVDVLPSRRYEKSIENGRGDCSNLAYGAAYLFIRENIDFSILHLLRVPGFPSGEGHVSLEVALQLDGEPKSAILDLLEGGVLQNDDGYISSADLIEDTPQGIIIRPFHPKKDRRSAYYTYKNLARTVLGFTPKKEVARYFKFVDALYINLGHRSLERYLFDSTALLLGIFPNIYVNAEDLTRIDEFYSVDRILSIFLLWAVRIGVGVLSIFLALRIYKRIFAARK